MRASGAIGLVQDPWLVASAAHTHRPECRRHHDDAQRSARGAEHGQHGARVRRGPQDAGGCEHRRRRRHEHGGRRAGEHHARQAGQAALDGHRAVDGRWLWLGGTRRRSHARRRHSGLHGAPAPRPPLDRRLPDADRRGAATAARVSLDRVSGRRRRLAHGPIGARTDRVAAWPHGRAGGLRAGGRRQVRGSRHSRGLPSTSSRANDRRRSDARSAARGRPRAHRGTQDARRPRV